MAAKFRLLSAMCALVAAVILVWQVNPIAGPDAGAVRLRSTSVPLSGVNSTIKYPVIATVNPRPFDPCEDIPMDVINRIGLAFTPPEHEDGLRCHYDVGNYQMTVRNTGASGHLVANLLLIAKPSGMDEPLTVTIKPKIWEFRFRHDEGKHLLHAWLDWCRTESAATAGPG